MVTAGVGGKGEDTITSEYFHHVSKKLSNKDETVAIVDCSWIAHKFGRIWNDIVGAVMKILLVLKGLYYHVIPVSGSWQINNAKRIIIVWKKYIWRKQSIQNTTECSLIKYVDSWVMLLWLWKKGLR